MIRRPMLVAGAVKLDPVPERAFGGALVRITTTNPSGVELDRDDLVELRDAIDEAIER